MMGHSNFPLKRSSEQHTPVALRSMPFLPSGLALTTESTHFVAQAYVGIGNVGIGDWELQSLKQELWIPFMPPRCASALQAALQESRASRWAQYWKRHNTLLIHMKIFAKHVQQTSPESRHFSLALYWCARAVLLSCHQHICGSTQIE